MPDISQVLILACALGVCRICYLLFFHPLSAYPGPRLARITNIWRFLNYFQGSQHTKDQDLHEKYGPVVRIGPDSLLFGEFAAYQAIYGINPKIEKGDFYLMSGDPDPKKRVVFQARSEEEHRLLRSRLAPMALSPKHMAEYEEPLSNMVRLFVGRLGEEQKKAHSAIDISKIVKRLTTDASPFVLLLANVTWLTRLVVDLVWGSPYGFLDAGYDRSGIIEAKDTVTQTTFGIALLPWLNRDLSIGPVFRYMTQRPRFDSEGNPTQLTALFIHLKKSFADFSDPSKSSGHVSILGNLLKVEEDNFTFAGPGSTAAAITCALYDIGLHPDWQSRIRADLLNLPTSPASNSSLLWKLPSLQAFLRESWRLSPPFLGVFERVIAKGAETVIPGVKGPLPLGTRVGSDPYVIMRSKGVFGDDAEQFKPERWLAEDEEYRRSIQDAWVVFGRGSRGCIGKDLALMLACETVAEVVSKWTIRSTPDGLKGRNNFERHYEQALVALEPIAK